jgi:hypothetical protein
LLNNVNPIALEYWLQKLDNQKLRKPFFYVYRDAIHAQNDFCAQKAKEARNLTLAKAPAPAPGPAPADIAKIAQF